VVRSLFVPGEPRRYHAKPNGSHINISPYSPPSNQSPPPEASSGVMRYAPAIFFVAGTIWGVGFWQFNDWFNSPPYPYNPTLLAHFLWMVVPAIATGFFGVSRFVFTATGLYLGTFLLHFPFMPSDPLLPLGMIIGVSFTLGFSLVGALIGSFARQTVLFALRSSSR